MKDLEVDLYSAAYKDFAGQVYADIRAEVFDNDIGQNGWLTSTEHDQFLVWLRLTPGRNLLDVACGSGGPTLRALQATGCRGVGIDLHSDAVNTARQLAGKLNVSDRVEFHVADAGDELPFSENTFDAIVCVDAINHLPHREQVLREWTRVLGPSGRIVFTDPIVVTGPLTHEEIAVRSSIGFFLFVPEGYDELCIEAAGLDLLEVHDSTANMAQAAEGYFEARRKRADELRSIEGIDAFEGQQRFFETTARIAAERRLSRFTYVATLQP